MPRGEKETQNVKYIGKGGEGVGEMGGSGLREEREGGKGGKGGKRERGKGGEREKGERWKGYSAGGGERVERNVPPEEATIQPMTNTTHLPKSSPNNLDANMTNNNNNNNNKNNTPNSARKARFFVSLFRAEPALLLI